MVIRVILTRYGDCTCHFYLRQFIYANYRLKDCNRNLWFTILTKRNFLFPSIFSSYAYCMLHVVARADVCGRSDFVQNFGTLSYKYRIKKFHVTNSVHRYVSIQKFLLLGLLGAFGVDGVWILFSYFMKKEDFVVNIWNVVWISQKLAENLDFICSSYTSCGVSSSFKITPFKGFKELVTQKQDDATL